MEEPLLPDTDRAYDLAGYGGMGKTVGEGGPEQGAEAQEAAGVLETGTPKGIRCGRRVPDQVRMVSRMEGVEQR